MRITSCVLVLATAVGTTDVVRPQPCSGTEHRRLDFLVGNWIIRDRSGAAVGAVTIWREYGGCVLLERWSDVDGRTERLGVTGYRPESGTWHRRFTARAGVVLALDGRWDGARMVMAGRDYGDPDRTRTHHIAWAPVGDGSVAELWRISDDGGQSWQVQRDHRLHRIAE